jgi:DNA-binding transcriptional LysR family regulator
MSSISAMVQLVQGGFGVTLLPVTAAHLSLCRLEITAVRYGSMRFPIHASYRANPTSLSSWCNQPLLFAMVHAMRSQNHAG